MNKIVFIVGSAIIWGILLYSLINLFSFSNSVKAVIAIIITILIFYILKIIDNGVIWK